MAASSPTSAPASAIVYPAIAAARTSSAAARHYFASAPTFAPDAGRRLPLQMLLLSAQPVLRAPLQLADLRAISYSCCSWPPPSSTPLPLHSSTACAAPGCPRHLLRHKTARQFCPPLLNSPLSTGRSCLFQFLPVYLFSCCTFSFLHFSRSCPRRSAPKFCISALFVSLRVSWLLYFISFYL